MVAGYCCVVRGASGSSGHHGVWAFVVTCLPGVAAFAFIFSHLCFVGGFLLSDPGEDAVAGSWSGGVGYYCCVDYREGEGLAPVEFWDWCWDRDSGLRVAVCLEQPQVDCFASGVVHHLAVGPLCSWVSGARLP